MFTTDTLKGQTIIITGGGSGLGLAMARALAACGASVVLWGRDGDKLEQARAAIAAEGGSVTIRSVDVRDYDAVGAAMSDHRATLTGLINNAAGNFFCPTEELSPNGFRTVVDIVLHGTFHCASHFGKILIAEKRGGAMLNIETTYTESGAAFLLPSACAKAGVHALTTTLALEWATYGIRANGIAPGPFPTEGAWSRLVPDSEFEKIYRDRHPMKRFGRHEELAQLAVFLMSPLAEYINGETITIDGGERLLGGQFNFLTNLKPRAELKSVFSAMRGKTQR